MVQSYVRTTPARINADLRYVAAKMKKQRMYTNEGGGASIYSRAGASLSVFILRYVMVYRAISGERSD